ncbi:exodeoxyribonuclease VII small subunit [Zhaonella formicivorans]|uniref:exodeoxyribonuclease VII small subunit n=1 Tax=Zhaonella formicivorans TaxID=2528593 RepID=UPI001D0FB820|nr:exodeoxyribonuclease VII small subunit [Zhaonella formicivorans]
MSELAKELTFENAMANLETIIRELETGAVTLEETLAKFEEGIRLLNFCQQKLTKAEERIAVLMETGSGHVRLEPWQPEGEKE